jgi:alpha,alpha-trehalase
MPGHDVAVATSKEPRSMPQQPIDPRLQPFRPLHLLDGYLPIEAYGMVGDGSTVALVGRNAAIDWLCAPRFDSTPLFAGILDKDKGGSFSVTPEELVATRHRYLGETPILITELETTSGVLRVTDVMPIHPDADLRRMDNANRGELLRVIELISGEVEFSVDISMYRHRLTRQTSDTTCTWRIDDTDVVDIEIESSRPFDGRHGTWTLPRGESVAFCLRWNGGKDASSVDAPVSAITTSMEAWSAWLANIRYDGPQRPVVIRSAITLKMLDYLPTGAIVAAPTTSLPEEIGGERNWDYRYVWIRDGSFSVAAFRRMGLHEEAWQFLAWILEITEGSDISVMYTLDGVREIPETDDTELAGYRNSQPVRWGNGAWDQTQHDVYGELVDAAFQWANQGGEISTSLWERLTELVERAATEWRTPDEGIWEVRSPGRLQTYSAALCALALDRGIRLAQMRDLPADIERWQRIHDEIIDVILEYAWSDELQSLTQVIRSPEDEKNKGHLDAALLTLPIRRVIPPDHPKMVATTEAIARELGAGDDLLYRYIPEKSPDGLSGDEGAFVLCSFWMVEVLVLQGRLDEAKAMYDRLCGRVNELGLLSEEIDPDTGHFLGNFPQAFSHIGLIAAGEAIARAEGKMSDNTPEPAL